MYGPAACDCLQFSTMSENSEHSPDDTETETKATEDLPNDSCKSEVKLMMNQTDAALLEDEEMPTYMSVSSTTKPNESDIAKQRENESQEMETDRSPSPYPSDDQGASSVYVLSSSEETDQQPYNDEDDEDEYGDSDDMENLELDNEFESEHPCNMKHLMDDEDDDDEDDEDEEDEEENPRQMHNDDDGIGVYCEMYCSDGRSDDFILNKRLKNRDKERSLSLQDLNSYENNTNAEYFKRKQLQGLKPNYINPNYFVPEPTVMCSIIQKRQPMSGKYHYVQSKVKRYIKDIKEQNRHSMEKHVKQRKEDTIYTDRENDDTERKKPPVTNKTIKDYAERTIKELEITETNDSDMDKVAYNARRNSSPQIILNGQDNKNYLESVHEESIQNEVNIPFESIQNERDTANTDNKMQKQNGTIEIKQLINYPNREISHLEDTVESPLIQNGHQEVPTVLYNFRTLSYEEYMHGSSDSNQKADLDRNAHVTEQESDQPERYESDLVQDLMDVSTDNDEDACPLRIENIKSIKTSDEEKDNEQIAFEKTNKFNKTTLDTSEVTILKRKLTQKTVKYNSLLDTYQKQLMENLKMKQELDELRKTLTKYKKENKPPEQKIASVQTDIIIESASNQQVPTEPTHVKQSDNKILGNSVASTLSSIDQWSSSACNLSISMKPPEITKTLHSDDSIILTDGTPRKTTRSLSHAFITSSRILQTLSNITQGKAKPENPLIQNSKKRLNENITMDSQSDDSSYQCQPSSSKKRKIEDVLEPSNYVQTFKTSPTATESHPKLIKMSNAESQFKNACDSINNVDTQVNSSNATNQLGATISSVENKTDIIDDPENNVKYFLYHEDENNKDRSFLIQAEEIDKGKAFNDKRFREGGPFLLGNVEVRMTEINGTINIWGKEISQESTIETENETEISTKVKDNNYHWQKAPHTRFNSSNLVCSTSKKSKNSKFELSSPISNFSCLHSSSFNIAKASCSTDKAHTDKPYSPHACVSTCEDCDHSKHRKEWLRYKRMHSQEKLYPCCSHNTDASEQKCNCFKLSTQEHRRYFSKHLEPNKRVCENVASEDSEHICKNCTACHHSLHNSDKSDCQENRKCCNTLRETEPLNINREYNEPFNHSSNGLHEEEPLITLNQCNETSETRQRRSTGRRVRGILMDLIRGCGDCYNSNVSSNSKSCIHKKESYLRNCPPQIKISPCSSPELSEQPAGRCCHAYAQRIESQLEEFRKEMEKMRSRSDAILNMLNMLHSVDIN